MEEVTKYYVDEAGAYLGAYCGAKPPTGAVEVDHPPLRASDRWTAGGWIAPLEAAQAAKRAEIRDAAEAAMARLAEEYCPLERQTWDQQAQEAHALANDLEAAAPLVRAIAAGRGMDVGEMAQRIIANEAAWKLVSGGIIGQRLAYQDQLDAATTAEEVEAIRPVYALSGAE